jgi:undecaprenyl-diphosphatase
VSSSGHLALLPYFFELKDPGVIFDLLMHLGTAIAVILYFHKEIKRLILEFMSLIFHRNLKDTFFVQNFLISTFFSFCLILIIKGVALDYGRTSLLIGINFIVFGLFMYLADKKKPTGLDLTKKRGLKEAIIIGLSQSLAIFPGVSRSGITLTSSRLLGMDRIEAGRFSFLLSLPVILGSIVFKLPDIMSGNATYVSPLVIAIGVLSSFLFGIVTIHFFLKLIGRLGLVYFSIYRVIIGLGLVSLYFLN